MSGIVLNFPCISLYFSRGVFVTVHHSVVHGKKFTDNGLLQTTIKVKFKMQVDAFYHSYIPQFFSLTSFAKRLKFPIHEFFKSEVL